MTHARLITHARELLDQALDQWGHDDEGRELETEHRSLDELVGGWRDTPPRGLPDSAEECATFDARVRAHEERAIAYRDRRRHEQGRTLRLVSGGGYSPVDPPDGGVPPSAA